MIEQQLREETEKWLEKARDKRKTIRKNSPHLKNIDAYLSDSQHFMGKNDWIRAFEAVIWAWAWIEILEDLGEI